MRSHKKTEDKEQTKKSNKINNIDKDNKKTSITQLVDEVSRWETGPTDHLRVEPYAANFLLKKIIYKSSMMMKTLKCQVKLSEEASFGRRCTGKKHKKRKCTKR